MRTKVVGVKILTCLILFTSLFKVDAQSCPDVLLDFDALMDDYFKTQRFNGTVLIAKEGELIYGSSRGFANKEKKVLNTLNTPFLIGSATKSFTAIAVMMAAQKGKVDLLLPIRNYLPELDGEAGSLNLHYLMKNSSGLPVHLNRITKLAYRDVSSRELLMLFNSIHLSFEPGTRFEYSNLNYQLCALVLERIFDQSYQELIEQLIFEPVKMHDSMIERTHSIAINKAIGYESSKKGLVRSKKNYMAYAMGGGDIVSTATDLMKWDQALYGELLLSEASKQKLFDGDPKEYGGYGYGFKIKRYQRNSTTDEAGILVRHGGSMFGYSCNIHRYLDDRILIVVLGNMRPYPVMEITVAIEGILREHGFMEAPKKNRG